MSFTQIQRHTHIASRTALSQALQQAIAHNHVQCLQEGYFDPKAGQSSKAAVYGVRWSDHATYPLIGSKTVPEKLSTQDDRFKNCTGDKGQDRFKNDTGIGSKTIPEDRFKNCTAYKIKQRNKTSKIKQQQRKDALPPVAADIVDIYTRLLQEGFDHDTAHALAGNFPAETIKNQCNWLKKRKATRNRLGLLRRAIEENWPEPQTSTAGKKDSEAYAFAAAFYAGYAGNEDDPVADPTDNDLAAAGRLLKRLLRVWPEKSKVPEWGRDFGRQVFESTRFQEGLIVSCCAALRSHGDHFYSTVVAERKRVLEQAKAEAQVEYQEQHWHEYLDYLQEREEQARSENPERYEKWFTGYEKRTRLFSLQDPEEARLRAFCDAANLLSFWDWDREVNRTKVGSESVRV